MNETLSTGTSVKNPGEPSREKYWSELTSDERVERLRQVIKSLQYRHDYTNEDMIKMQNHFYKHQHDAKGALIAPLTQYDGGLGGSLMGQVGVPTKGGNPNEVYF
jgi:hypothetical protein